MIWVAAIVIIAAFFFALAELFMPNDWDDWFDGGGAW